MDEHKMNCSSDKLNVGLLVLYLRHQIEYVNVGTTFNFAGECVEGVDLKTPPFFC